MTSRWIVALLAVVAVASCANASPLGNVLLQNNSVVVTGLSSGGFMAVQYHVAYSSSLIGAVVIAGGPFYCAMGQEIRATEACMSIPEMINVNELASLTKTCASEGNCDPVDNLAKQKVWLFSGTKDTVVHQGVMEKLKQYYGAFIDSSLINSTFDMPAEHSWVTNNFGSACAHLGSPYINNCNFDASFASLDYIVGPLQPPVQAKGLVKTINQETYTPGKVKPSSLSLGPNAYAYVSTGCANGTAACPLVIAFHGCQQTIDDIGSDFIEHIALNEVAEANNFVVLYPQAIKSYFPIQNPEGCWDWWGYGSKDYANNKGPQMQTVKNIVDALFA